MSYKHGRFSVFRCVATLLLAWLGVVVAFASDDEVVALRADQWCPFNCEPDSDRPGLLVEVAQRAFAEEGVDYRLMNWARAVETTRSGRFDGIVGAFVGDAPDFHFPAQSISRTRNCFYRLEASPWRFQSLASLAGIRLGISNGYDYGAEMDAYIRENADQPQLILVASGDLPTYRNISLLRHERIDAFIESREVMGWLAENEALEDIQVAGCLPVEQDVHIAFSPSVNRARHLARRLEATVAKMTASGEMRRLHRRYGIDFEPEQGEGIGN